MSSAYEILAVPTPRLALAAPIKFERVFVGYGAVNRVSPPSCAVSRASSIWWTAVRAIAASPCHSASGRSADALPHQ
jgi:hypothetical protein